MLGIDIADNSIRIVSLRRRGNSLVLQGILELPFESNQATDPIALGAILKEALLDKGWLGQSAVMTLPDCLGFVKRYSLKNLTCGLIFIVYLLKSGI